MSKEKPDVWFPLMVSSYMKKTWGLTAEQHGAYLLLLINYWVDGPPADNDQVLAGLTRMTPAQWKRARPVMLQYFRIEEGRWRQERADEELVRWAERKRRFAERASAGGRGKAAKSTAKSTPKAVLEGCTSSSSTEVRGPSSPLTLSGQNEFLGPKEVRDAFAQRMGEAWCVTWLDRCAWQDVPERALIPATRIAGDRIRQDCRPILSDLSVKLLERAA